MTWSASASTARAQRSARAWWAPATARERIRTYNFPQGRVTDHRINLTLYKLDRIITGDELGEDRSTRWWRRTRPTASPNSRRQRLDGEEVFRIRDLLHAAAGRLTAGGRGKCAARCAHPAGPCSWGSAGNN